MCVCVMATSRIWCPQPVLVYWKCSMTVKLYAHADTHAPTHARTLQVATSTRVNKTV